MSPTPSTREYYIIKNRHDGTFMADYGIIRGRSTLPFTTCVDYPPRLFPTYEKALRCLREYVRGEKHPDLSKPQSPAAKQAQNAHPFKRYYGPCKYVNPRNITDYEISICRMEVR